MQLVSLILESVSNRPPHHREPKHLETETLGCANPTGQLMLSDQLVDYGIYSGIRNITIRISARCQLLILG